MEEFNESLYRECGRVCAGREHVLCIQDTTELCYDSIAGRIDDDDAFFGYGTGRGSSKCLFAHPSLVLDASSGLPLGFSSLRVWGRGGREKRVADEHKSLPLERKESYRWAEAAETTARVLPSEVRKTMVGDRENDIYEVMCRTLRCGCDFLIRSSNNRLAVGEGRLSEVMEGAKAVCTYDLPLVGRKGRRNRTARMELRFRRVRIGAALRVPEEMPRSLDAWCIHTREVGTVPDGEAPVEWRLLTSHSIETVEDALRCIGWYRLRWTVESLFRMVKSKGLAVGEAQVESGMAMMKLISLALVAAQRAMTLKKAHEDGLEDEPASVMFTDSEVEVMAAVCPSLEPRSPRYTKGRNPFRPRSLPWAAWVVAMLAGGWDGREADRKNRPGFLKYVKGLDRLKSMTWAVEVVRKNVYKD